MTKRCSHADLHAGAVGSWQTPTFVAAELYGCSAGAKLDRDSVKLLEWRGYTVPPAPPQRSIGCSVAGRGWVRPDGRYGVALSAVAAQRVLDEWYVPGQIALLDDMRLVEPRVEAVGRLGLWKVAP